MSGDDHGSGQELAQGAGAAQSALLDAEAAWRRRLRERLMELSSAPALPSGCALTPG
jgi:hypothetical protein